MCRAKRGSDVTVIIGNISQIMKPQAERWLAQFVEGQGISDARYLARSQSPVLTFGLAARGWIDRHLIVNKKPLLDPKGGEETSTSSQVVVN
jgi:hypothetical protein